MLKHLRLFVLGLGFASVGLASAPAAAQFILFPGLGVKNPTHTLYKESGGVVSCYGRASNCKIELDKPKLVGGLFGSPIGF